MSSTSVFTEREIKGRPSTPRVRMCLDRYLSEPLYIDCEYMRHYTRRYGETAHWEAQERRAECHAFALERLTPVIHDGELIVGGKTVYTRGAIPYANYASDYILRELRKEKQDDQDTVTDLGTGGGIADVHRKAEQGGFQVFCHKFLISQEDHDYLWECADYWSDKCLQGEGDKLWKAHYPNAQWISDGWKTVLYTAPHEPAPEGRFIIDFETILEKGLNHIIRRCQEKINEAFLHPGAIKNTRRVHFWRGAIRVLEASVKWGQNYGNLALKMASEEKDPVRRRELETIAAGCLSFGGVPADFRQAVQHFWLAYLAGHIEGAHLGYSVGRFDRYMYPFYRKSMEKGEINEGEVLELLELLRIKHTELEYVASFSWEGLGSGNLFQNLILGGYNSEGKPADNELSVLILQAGINAATTQPTLSIWWTPGLSEKFLMKAAECVKSGAGYPAWFNTDVYIKHELSRNPQLGIGFIRKYAAMGGCTEPVLEGASYGVVQPGFINHLKLFELALFGGKDPRTGIVIEERPVPHDYDSLVSQYEYFMEKAIVCWQEYWNVVMEAHSRTVPLIYCSAVMRDCVERGANMDDGGLLNEDSPTTLSSGLVNVANSLESVRALLREGTDLDFLRNALLADWDGYELLRRKALSAPKWGNDDPDADRTMEDLWNYYCSTVEKGENYLGRPYDPSMLAISTPAPFGKACLATPDGRKSGESLADGVTSPHPGTDIKGPTAVLRSVQKLDHTRIRGGLHNMKFHPSALTGVQGSLKLIQLVKTLFETQTAFQIQFNVVDGGMLRDAQQHPENYRDLIVRVAGFSAFFVELQKSAQDQVIERTEHAL